MAAVASKLREAKKWMLEIALPVRFLVKWLLSTLR
jgi:hypothetical protein